MPDAIAVSDGGTVRELDCRKCSGVMPHTYERHVKDGGISLTGAEWRSCTFGWTCASCGTVLEPVEDREEFDPITGEWQARHRRSVRVPVAGQRLHVVVRAVTGPSWNPAGVNLSTTGILVEFPPDVAPRELELGAELKVALRFETLAVMLDAEVKRRDRNQYGIAFALVVDNEVSFEPDPLRMLVAALELRWLAARAR